MGIQWGSVYRGWLYQGSYRLDEGNLQRMYDYPARSVRDLFLHVLGKRLKLAAICRFPIDFDF